MTNTNAEIRPDKNGKLVTRHVRYEAPAQARLQRFLNPQTKPVEPLSPNEKFAAIPDDQKKNEVLAILSENGNENFDKFDHYSGEFDVAEAVIANQLDIIESGLTSYEEKVPVIRWAQGVVAARIFRDKWEEYKD